MKTFLLFATLAISGWSACSTRARADEGDSGTVVSLKSWAEDSTQSKMLEVGSPVKVGDKISTGPETYLRIMMGKDVAVQVGPNSVFTLEHVKSKPWLLDLVVGSVMSAVRKTVRKTFEKELKFQLKTSNTVMGVRGTVFFVDKQPEAPPFLCVCMGTVDVDGAAGRIKKSITGHHHESQMILRDAEAKPAAVPAKDTVAHSEKDMKELVKLFN